MSVREQDLRAALRMVHRQLDDTIAALEDAAAEVRILKAERAELRSCLAETVPVLRKVRDRGTHIWSVENGNTLRWAVRLLR